MLHRLSFGRSQVDGSRTDRDKPTDVASKILRRAKSKRQFVVWVFRSIQYFRLQNPMLRLFWQTGDSTKTSPHVVTAERMIQTVQATVFHRFMTKGRTSPALCGCEDIAGQAAGDFVVKLRGGTERGATALICELVASRLASYFRVAVPVPALVSIHAGFAELVATTHPGYSRRMRESIGLNFGSRQLNDVMTWPVDRSIPDAMWPTAVSIFAFDALIQNPDRKFSPNPNLFSRGDQIFVYDHELAFSFIENIFPAEAPWRLGRSEYLTEHVFFSRLRRKEIDLTGFMDLLAALPDVSLPAILADVPAEWNNSSLSKINDHLCAVARQSALFADEIRRRLA
jgi:hypothetical protein